MNWRPTSSRTVWRIAAPPARNSAAGVTGGGWGLRSGPTGEHVLMSHPGLGYSGARGESSVDDWHDSERARPHECGTLRRLRPTPGATAGVSQTGRLCAGCRSRNLRRRLSRPRCPCSSSKGIPWIMQSSLAPPVLPCDPTVARLEMHARRRAWIRPAHALLA